MSYILDALRKSERERALGNVRTLEAPPAVPGASSRRRALHRAVFGGALVAVAAALGWVFTDRIAATVARLQADGEREAQTAPQPADLAGVAQPEAPPAEAPPAEVAPVSDVPDQTPQSAPVAPTPNPVSAAATPMPAAVPAPAHPNPAEPEVPPLLSPNEAPPAVRDAVDRLFLSVVSYSREPQRRFVMINQVFYREGDKLPGGVKLRRIEPDGAVVEFRGSQVLLKP